MRDLLDKAIVTGGALGLLILYGALAILCAAGPFIFAGWALHALGIL